MPSQKTKLAVGLFLVVGTAVALVALIWLGVTRYFEKGYLYVTYLNESVQGLEKASPVKYRGVTIGRVESISVAPDSKLIKVVLKVETGMVLDSNIVAQLRNVGITGSMFVELDQRKEGEPDQSPPLTFPSEYPIVASKPAEISELLRGLDEVLTKLKAINLDRVVHKFEVNLDLVGDVFRQANVEAISRKAEKTLDEMNRLMDQERWDEILETLQNTIQSADAMFARSAITFDRAESIMVDKGDLLGEALEDFREATRRANALFDSASSLTGGAEDTLTAMRSQLVSTARNLERASRNLDRLMELVAEQPSQLFFGRPPPARDVKQ
jgi:phospholipid/cholesterol/gamma-HCH transport system substrate-binding protein